MPHVDLLTAGKNTSLDSSLETESESDDTDIQSWDRLATAEILVDPHTDLELRTDELRALRR